MRRMNTANIANTHTYNGHKALDHPSMLQVTSGRLSTYRGISNFTVEYPKYTKFRFLY